MRQGLAKLYVASMLGGCSLLYNPNNIPAGDAPVVIADADPTMLEITDVGPRVLLEGQGEGGSRRAILTLTGHHFVTGARVELQVPATETVMLTVHDAELEIAPTRDVLAVPVTVPVDTARASGDVPVTVVVSQGGTTRMLEGRLVLRHLPELDAAVSDTAMLAPLYARVQLAGDWALAPGANRMPAIVRAVSSIAITGTITANATGQTPGPGGRVGGDGTQGGDGAGGGGPGGLLTTGGLFTGGGGAGHASAGTSGGGSAGNAGAAIGDALVTSYADSYGSGGGGGSSGRVGGGGGGTVELTAGGTVQAGAIEVRGGDGGSNCTIGQGCGGGGAGGVIVVRAATSATLGDLSPEAGAGGVGNGSDGGAGSVGRIRVDAHELVGGTATAGAVHRGVAFDPALPLTTRDFRQQIFVSGTMGDRFDVAVLNAGGASVHLSKLDLAVATTASLNTELGPGYNRVCVFPEGGGLQLTESVNCLDIALLP